MPTPAERRALVFLAALAALGVAARGISGGRGSAADDRSAQALDRQLAAVDAASRAAAGRGGSGGRGKRVASRGRDTVGAKPAARPAKPAPDGPLTVLPELLALYEARRQAVERANEEARRRVAERTLALTTPRRGPIALPDPGSASPAPGTGTHGRRPSTDTTGPVDLDTAGEAALQRLPGIGPALAARIVADRRSRGPFGSLDGLQRVKGIGPSLAERLRPSVTFSRRLSATPTLVPTRRLAPPRRRP